MPPKQETLVLIDRCQLSGIKRNVEINVRCEKELEPDHNMLDSLIVTWLEDGQKTASAFDQHFVEDFREPSKAFKMSDSVLDIISNR